MMAFLNAQTADRLHRQITGRRPETKVTDLAGAIRETYGTNSRGNPDVRTAAADMGVSERTMRRWVRGESKPSRDNAGKDIAAIERAEQQRQQRMADPKYRAAQMPPTRQKRFAKNGMTLGISGRVRISSDVRPRDFGNFRVPGAAAERINQAWLSGDDAALKTAVESALSTHHLGGMDAEIQSLSGMKISR